MSQDEKQGKTKEYIESILFDILSMGSRHRVKIKEIEIPSDMFNLMSEEQYSDWMQGPNCRCRYIRGKTK